jgi:hypothetical protein
MNSLSHQLPLGEIFNFQDMPSSEPSLGNQPLLSLHKVIPQIAVRDREELWKFWKDIPYDVISVGYLDLIKNKKLYSAAKRYGIKSALDFSGTLIASLVGENYLLDRIRPDDYVNEIEEMGFDAATTYDDYIYPTDPEVYRWSRIQRLLDKARFIVDRDPSFAVIGLAQGSNPVEISFCVRELTDLNLANLAFPCGELLGIHAHSRVRFFLEALQDRKMWKWLIGVNSLKSMETFNADAYSGKAWSYKAAHNFTLIHGKWRQVAFVNCNHPVCNLPQLRKLPLQVRCARHSISTLIEYDEKRLRGNRIG